MLRHIREKNLETNFKTIIPHSTLLFDFCALVCLHLLYLSQCACACVMHMRSHLLLCCDMVPARHLRRSDRVRTGKVTSGQPERTGSGSFGSTACGALSSLSCMCGTMRVMSYRHLQKGREAWISCKRSKQGEEGCRASASKGMVWK